MFCEECGKQLEEGAGFCIHCGARISDDRRNKQDDEQLTPTPEEAYRGFSESSVPSDKRRSGNGLRAVAIVALSVFCIGVGCLIAYGVMHQGDGSGNEQPSAEEASEGASAEGELSQSSGSDEVTSSSDASSGGSGVVSGSASADASSGSLAYAAPVTSGGGLSGDVAPPGSAYGSEFLFPDSYKRVYTKGELYSYDLYTLFLGRNEIYARYGRMFKSAELQNYFKARSWYRPLYTPEEFSDSFLSDIERKNASLFLEVERERNSPYI